jgi:DNA primase
LRDHLAERGISRDTAARFGIGFAPDTWRSLRSGLGRYGDALMIDAGLLVSFEGKAPYDRFRGRLMIPIRDPQGRVIAFGARALGNEEPKYLNSPRTLLFDKGHILFNFDRASQAVRQVKRVIVVEGYLDVVALAQAGITEVVSPLGTALSGIQLEQLWQLSDTPIICFDGDQAGQDAAIKIIERALPLLKGARSLKFVTLENGYDPEEMIVKQGVAALDANLNNAAPLVDWLWRHEFAAEELATPEARAGLRARLIKRVTSISDGEVRRHYETEFRTRFDAAFPITRLQDANV